MKQASTLTVKGTKYYEASDLHEKGELKIEDSVLLEHQPDNQHDKNAVAVFLENSKAMLGYISRDSAPKYANIVRKNEVKSSFVTNIEKRYGYIYIRIKVISEIKKDEYKESNIYKSLESVQDNPGVYSIKNIKTNRSYIGSSKNIKLRAYRHINDLFLQKHPNKFFQDEFIKYGHEYFVFNVLSVSSSEDGCRKEEEQIVSSLIRNGAMLYNKTADGQPAKNNPSGHEEYLPISDRLKIEMNKKAEDSFQKATFDNVNKSVTKYEKIKSWFRNFF